MTPDVVDAHARTQAKQGFDDNNNTNEKRYTGKMKRAKRSAICIHFNLVNDDKDAKCTICGSVLQYNKSTTSLNYHLNTSHSVVLQGASGSQPTITAAKAEGIT